MPGIFSRDFWLGGGGYEMDPYQNPYAGQEEAIGNLLWEQAQGLGVSPAQQQMQMGLASAQRQAASSAAGMRGASPGMALRLAMGQQGQMGMQATAQSSLLRSQEQARAQAMYAQYLQGLHGLGQQEYLGRHQIMGSQQGTPGFFGNLMGAGVGAAAAYLGGGGGNERKDNAQ